MTYIVNQDIIDRVGSAAALQLTTDSGTVVDQAVLDEVRQSAEGEVNGYLARRYAVPVDLTAHADLTATLNGYTLDIAVYRLMGRRPPVSEDYEKIRANALEWLVRVSKGEIVLPAAATPAATTADDPPGEYGSQAQNLSKMPDSL